MARRRQHDNGAVGAPPEDERRVATVLRPVAWRLRAAANDNEAPLSERLWRLLFPAVAAATVGWLFWIGVLR